MVLPLFRNYINFSKSCVMHLTHNFLQPMFGRGEFKSWCWHVEEESKLVEWGREELVSVCTRHRIRLLVTYCSSGFVYIHSFILLVGVCVSTASFSDAHCTIPSCHFTTSGRPVENCFSRDGEYLIAPATLATPLTGDEHSLMQPVIRSNSRQEMHEYVIPKLAPMNNFLLSCTLSL